VTFKRFEDVKRNLHKIHELVTAKLPARDFFDLLKVKAQEYAEHHFVAQWQHAQKAALVEALPFDDRLVFIDFAENMTHSGDFVIQQQMFAKKQTSILVILVGRRDRPTSQSQDPRTRYTTYFYCSDNNTHDLTYVTLALTHLLRQLGPGLRRVHVFSDGAPSQFKNRYLMNWVSGFEAQFDGAQCFWNFFATCHGRGVWDAEGGRLKAKLGDVNRRVTKAGEMPIRCAKDIVEWAGTEEGQRFCGAKGELEGRIIERRAIYLLKPPSRRSGKEVEALAGIRSLYAVASCGQVGTVLFTRLSCYCKACLAEDSENCTAPEVLGDWQTHVF